MLTFKRAMKPLDEAQNFIELEKEKTQRKISATEKAIQDAISEREKRINEIE